MQPGWRDRVRPRGQHGDLTSKCTAVQPRKRLPELVPDRYSCEPEFRLCRPTSGLLAASRSPAEDDHPASSKRGDQGILHAVATTSTMEDGNEVV
jgi:hypothetical protein